MSKRLCTLRKLMTALTILAAIGLVALMAACNQELKKPDTVPVYRGEVPDSVYLQQAQIEQLADLLKYKQELIYQERDNSATGILYKVVGVVIMLLLSGLLWFLREQLLANKDQSRITRNLQTEVQRLSFTIATNEEYGKDYRNECHNTIQDHETRIRKLETK